MTNINILKYQSKSTGDHVERQHSPQIQRPQVQTYSQPEHMQAVDRLQGQINDLTTKVDALLNENNNLKRLISQNITLTCTINDNINNCLNKDPNNNLYNAFNNDIYNNVYNNFYNNLYSQLYNNLKSDISENLNDFYRFSSSSSESL